VADRWRIGGGWMADRRERERGMGEGEARKRRNNKREQIYALPQHEKGYSIQRN
jgi:hypothetical protein